MSTQTSSFRLRGAQRGVTMIELMIALLLGIVLTGGTIQIFISNRATYAFNEGLARLQENGRFALDTLSYHARLAGYLGCLSEVPRYNNLNTPTTLPFNFEEGLGGYEAIGTSPGEAFAAAALNPPNSNDASDWAPSLPAELVGSVVPGSDVLVIRHASPTSHTLLSPFTSSTVVTAVATADDNGGGETPIVSDCQKPSIFQITGVANTPGASRSGTSPRQRPAT